ncbi:LuxR C-terminal-related transcriptional regulator [Actinokineospora sp.]|uniref:LuxR C-terminal-related transcriptional regulator n=1 Tax=Actinokineospora sp. TaxID=1872133 RepID=UPI00403844E5
MDSPRTRVLVSIDNELMRYGLTQMLSELPIVGFVRSVGDYDATAALLSGGRFDVVVVSVATAVEVTERIVHAARQHGAASLLLLRQSEDALAPNVAALDVSGFLLEPGLSGATLADSLQKLRRGDMPIPGALALRIIDELRTVGRSRSDVPFMLTPRERQALNLLAEGLSNKQIARRLGISEHGAKRHVGNVLAKLNCPNRTVAVTMALNHGLLTEDTRSATPDPAVVSLRRRIVSGTAKHSRRDGIA